MFESISILIKSRFSAQPMRLAVQREQFRLQSSAETTGNPRIWDDLLLGFLPQHVVFAAPRKGSNCYSAKAELSGL